MFFRRSLGERACELNEAERRYMLSLDADSPFLNTVETALPQTEIAGLVAAHFAQGGAKPKKALVIGWDGARADAAQFLCRPQAGHGAVGALKERGGLYLSFAGGEGKHLQKTKTQQGWASILTGRWGFENGVLEHQPLRRSCPTVLYSLAQKGVSAAFLAEWPEHFLLTYTQELLSAKLRKLPLRFVKTDTDFHLRELVRQSIRGGTDCTFCIFETPDHNGHATGFGMSEPGYAGGIVQLDRFAHELFKDVARRDTVDAEDWLILITSDHGGHGTDHGSQSPFDRLTFIACNRKL